MTDCKTTVDPRQQRRTEGVTAAAPGAAVTAEVAALPLVHSAWLTAIVFSIANALVLNVRIRAEDAALGYV